MQETAAYVQVMNTVSRNLSAMTEATGASLTVVIPHLNGPEGLQRCLAALDAERAASGVEFDVHVVDNGSRVLPEAVCAAFPFVRLMQEAEPGPGPARTTGARAATSDLLGFIDADCVPRPGWVREMLSYFAANPEVGVIGGDVRIARAEPGRITGVEAFESVYGYRMQLYVERDGYTATCNMGVRREIFDQVGAFGGITIAEDVDWGRRATAQGIRIDYVPNMVIETPARADFSELARKWDRHMGHDFAEVTGLGSRARWIAKALALVVSPLKEIPTLLSTDRLGGIGERITAFGMLSRIRAYRAKRMLALLIGVGPSSKSAWRKE